jgi:hypothetical protein
MVKLTDPFASTLADWPTDPVGRGGTAGDGAAEAPPVAPLADGGWGAADPAIPGTVTPFEPGPGNVVLGTVGAWAGPAAMVLEGLEVVANTGSVTPPATRIAAAATSTIRPRPLRGTNLRMREEDGGVIGLGVWAAARIRSVAPSGTSMSSAASRRA